MVHLCLIGGTGRSGTTVLRRALGRHPSVATLPIETRFLVDPDGLVDFYIGVTARWSPFDADVRLNRLASLLRRVSTDPLRRPHRPPRDLPTGPQLPGASKRPGVARRFAHGPMMRLRPSYYGVDIERWTDDFGPAVEALLEELVEFEYHGRWIGKPLSQPSRMLFGASDPEKVRATLASFYQRVVGSIADRYDATHFVEDSPLNLLSWDHVLELLGGEPRLVHIHRDPRDVVASLAERRRWSPDEPVQAARTYAAMMQRWFTIRDRVPEESYLELSLEDLAREPESVLRRVCAFTGLDWHPAVLNEPLDRSRSGRWLTDLPSASRVRVEEILAPFVSAYDRA